MGRELPLKNKQTLIPRYILKAISYKKPNSDVKTEPSQLMNVHYSRNILNVDSLVSNR